jgi:hypothetical protein
MRADTSVPNRSWRPSPNRTTLPPSQFSPARICPKNKVLHFFDKAQPGPMASPYLSYWLLILCRCVCWSRWCCLGVFAKAEPVFGFQVFPLRATRRAFLSETEIFHTERTLVEAQKRRTPFACSHTYKTYTLVILPTFGPAHVEISEVEITRSKSV